MATVNGARVVRWIGLGTAVAAATYAAVAGAAWQDYGRPAPPQDDEADPLLDRFIPVYEAVERHDIRVAAPAAVTFAVARDQDLLQSPAVRAIFKAREVILGGRADARDRPHGLVAEMQSIGWGVLAEIPDREIVMGAVTRPWEANPVFRALPPDDFAAFAEPGYVKIVWTLRADPRGAVSSTFRTETRVLTTDAAARDRFRPYWALASPGIALIRRWLLRPLKREAERRTCAAAL
jgi:hypothetical protein